MKIKYHKGIDELRRLIDASGIIGNWIEDNKGKHPNKYTFKSQQKGTLNYWPRTGTIQCQGKEKAKTELEAIFTSGGTEPSLPSTAAPKDKKTKIFVVHGHDPTALEQLELILRRLALDPYILQNNDGESKTLIEALEQQIYEEAAFGIVLLTPDDFGYPKDKKAEDRQPRARQNVILELGMVLASLGRERMVILKKGALEIPSDVSGIIYLEFNEHVKEVAIKLATRMKTAGIEIDDAKIRSVAT